MKKRLLLIALVLLGFTKVSAQNENFYGVFNHVGAGVSVGTEGIGINVASPLTKYLEVSAGVNFMPGFKVDGDVDVDFNDINVGGTAVEVPVDQVNIEGKFARTTFDFKVSCYPFGDKNALFVAAGFSFGGSKIAKLKGHSDDLQRFIADNPQYKDLIYAQIDKYQLNFDENGDASGEIKVNSFRPYFGIGYGRLVPKHRVGFRAELGLQVHGHMKVYQGGSEVKTDDLADVDDDISKIIDKFTVYPVLKFTLTGRIF